VQIGAERVRQHQYRGILRPFDFDVNIGIIISFYLWHFRPPGLIMNISASQKMALGSTWEAAQKKNPPARCRDYSRSRARVGRSQPPQCATCGGLIGHRCFLLGGGAVI
jgi:hypothetical protein